MSSLCERTEPPNGGLIKINMMTGGGCESQRAQVGGRHHGIARGSGTPHTGHLRGSCLCEGGSVGIEYQRRRLPSLGLPAPGHFPTRQDEE